MVRRASCECLPDYYRFRSLDSDRVAWCEIGSFMFAAKRAAPLTRHFRCRGKRCRSDSLRACSRDLGRRRVHTVHRLDPSLCLFKRLCNKHRTIRRRKES